MNFSSASSCFHNLFSGQPLWFLQCQRVIGTSSLAAMGIWRSAKNRRGGVIGHGGRSAAGGRMCWSLGSLVMFEKTTGMCVVVNGCPWQVSLRGSQARDRMLIPGETAQPSVPIWVLLLVHDGKEKKYPSLPFPSPVKSTLTWIQIQTNNTRSVDEGKHDFLSIHYLKSPLLPLQGEMLGVRSAASCSGLWTKWESTRKDMVNTVRSEKNKQMWLRSWELQPQIHNHTGNHNTF